MLVKICGIKTEAAAQAAVEAGADFIGFVFAESKRQISPEQAAELSRMIPSSIKKVGVFVNEEVETMNEIAALVGLDYIQLHGDESAEVARQLNRKVIKAFPANFEKIKEAATFPCDFYLIDTPSATERGGSGKTFPWEIINELNVNKEKLILAGGLTSENIQEAIATAQPYAVDVSSGVETAGEKDITKIRIFIASAKQKEEQE